jgi:sugar O-acyltransferase (sialic acid O-acetyltransferase NeuD family)
MKKKILIIGTGGHAGSCLDVINSSKELSIYGLIAKSKSEKSKLSGHKIVGTENDLEKLFNHIKYAFIAFGNIKSFQRRLTLYNKLKKIGYKLPTVISKFAHVSKNSIIGEGTIIMHGTFVNSGSKIGNNCIINSKSVIEHDVEIGNNSHVAPGSVICGNVNIGNNTMVGAGSVVKNNVKILSNSIVGANSFLDRNLKSNKIFISRSNKIIKNK